MSIGELGGGIEVNQAEAQQGYNVAVPASVFYGNIFANTFYDAPGAALTRWSHLGLAGFGGEEKFSPQEIEQKYGIKTKKPLSQPQIDLKQKWDDEKFKREEIVELGKESPRAYGAQFGTGLAAGLVDPLNVAIIVGSLALEAPTAGGSTVALGATSLRGVAASGFKLLGGNILKKGTQAAITKGAGAVLGNAAIGAVEGVVGGAISEGVGFAAKNDMGEEYTLGQLGMNVLAGGVLGAGIGGGVGIFQRAINKGTLTPQLHQERSIKAISDLLADKQPDLKLADELHTALRKDDLRESILLQKREADPNPFEVGSKRSLAEAKQEIPEFKISNETLLAQRQLLKAAYAEGINNTSIIGEGAVRDTLEGLGYEIKTNKKGGTYAVDGFHRIRLDVDTISVAGLPDDVKLRIAEKAAYRDVANGTINENFVKDSYGEDLPLASEIRDILGQQTEQRMAYDLQKQFVDLKNQYEDLVSRMENFKSFEEGQAIFEEAYGNEMLASIDDSRLEEAFENRVFELENQNIISKVQEVSSFEKFDNLTDEQENFLEYGQLEDFAASRGYTPEQAVQFVDALGFTSRDVLTANDFRKVVSGDVDTIRTIANTPETSRTPSEILEEINNKEFADDAPETPPEDIEAIIKEAEQVNSLDAYKELSDFDKMKIDEMVRERPELKEKLLDEQTKLDEEVKMVENRAKAVQQAALCVALGGV